MISFWLIKPIKVSCMVSSKKVSCMASEEASILASFFEFWCPFTPHLCPLPPWPLVSFVMQHSLATFFILEFRPTMRQGEGLVVIFYFESLEVRHTYMNN